MAKKTKMPMNENFESSLSRSGFTKICIDMLESKAWMSLKPRQKGLYLTLKSKYKKNPRTGEDMHKDKKLQEIARSIRNEKVREWRHKNKDKIKEINRRYWLKKAKAKLSEENNKEEE